MYILYTVVVSDLFVSTTVYSWMMDGWTDGQTDKRMDAWMGRQMNGWIDTYMYM